MHNVNKEAREFLKNNYITIKNGFSNEGLIEYEAKFDDQGLIQLELYIQKTIQRNAENRNLTISLHYSQFQFFIQFLENSPSTKFLNKCFVKTIFWSITKYLEALKLLEPYKNFKFTEVSLKWSSMEDKNLSTPINLCSQNIPGLGTNVLTRSFQHLFNLEIRFRFDQSFIRGITYIASKFD